MSLKDWLKNGWLLEHETSANEIADLLEVAERDMDDCQVKGLSADWRLWLLRVTGLQGILITTG